MTVNQSELAELLGVSIRTIQRWGKDGLDDCRVGDGATYDLAAAIAWRLDSVQSEDDDEYRVARTRVATAKAEAAERENAVAARELIPMEELEPLVRESLEGVAAILRQCPVALRSEWAVRLGFPVKDAEELIRDLVEDVKAALREPDLSGLQG